ncbi:MAG: hypothetical protein RLZ10_2546 [Bacteroidota bacterium]|jgi:hypothetical protein
MRNLLLPVYLLARILKSPLWWVAQPPFFRWKRNNESIKKDVYFLIFISAFYFSAKLISSIITIIVSLFLYALYFIFKNRD